MKVNPTTMNFEKTFSYLNYVTYAWRQKKREEKTLSILEIHNLFPYKQQKRQNIKETVFESMVSVFGFRAKMTQGINSVLYCVYSILTTIQNPRPVFLRSWFLWRKDLNSFEFKFSIRERKSTRKLIRLW